MKRNPNILGQAVELLNVPRYYQGTFDHLCVYYTGAMMLAALFPEYAVKFGTSGSDRRAVRTMSRDPLIKKRVSAGPRDDRKTLARWFYKGDGIKNVVKTLNEVVEANGQAALFESRDMNRVDGTFETITDSIDVGLPVMLGWNTEDYNCHAVLVVGYWRGQENWLTIHDPSGATEVSWNSLMYQQEGGGRFEIGFCDKDHWGPRPLMSVTDKDGSTTVHQWMPPGKWMDLHGSVWTP